MKREHIDMSHSPLDGLVRGPRTRKSSKRYRDAGALYARHPNTDLVVLNKRDPEGRPLWAWAERNKDPFPSRRGVLLEQARGAAEGQLVLVYDPACALCPGELEGCHYCHAPYNDSPCPICGRGLFMTDDHGWMVNSDTGDALMVVRDYTPPRPYYSNPEDLDADLNEVPAEELGEFDPMLVAVNEALTEWYCDPLTGDPHYNHRVATFLDTLADRGYRVVKIEAPDLATLLPAPEGNTQ